MDIRRWLKKYPKDLSTNRKVRNVVGAGGDAAPAAAAVSQEYVASLNLGPTPLLEPH